MVDEAGNEHIGLWQSFLFICGVVWDEVSERFGRFLSSLLANPYSPNQRKLLRELAQFGQEEASLALEPELPPEFVSRRQECIVRCMDAGLSSVEIETAIEVGVKRARAEKEKYAGFPL